MLSRLIRFRYPRLAALAVAVFLVCVATAWPATTETFVPTIVQYPGSTSTVARGINNRGDIVGTYVCAVACINPVTGETSTAGTHGFLLHDDAFTRIDVPGGTATVARGISTQGVIVGHRIHNSRIRLLRRQLRLSHRRTRGILRSPRFATSGHARRAHLTPRRPCRLLSRRQPGYDDHAWLAPAQRHIYCSFNSALYRRYQQPRSRHNE